MATKHNVSTRIVAFSQPATSYHLKIYAASETFGIKAIYEEQALWDPVNS